MPSTLETTSITIITDSRSSILSLKKIYSENWITQEIHSKLYNSDKQFSLCWVPSHTGIPGNERADLLAKQSEHLPSSKPLKIPRSDMKSYTKSKIKESWRNEWTNTQSNKLREVTESTSELPNSNCSNREWEVKLCRLRIGHTHLTHSHLMTRTNPPECVCGEEATTVKHLLLECPSYDQPRLRFFPNPNRTLNSILKEGDTNYRGALFNF